MTSWCITEVVNSYSDIWSLSMSHNEECLCLVCGDSACSSAVLILWLTAALLCRTATPCRVLSDQREAGADAGACVSQPVSVDPPLSVTKHNTQHVSLCQVSELLKRLCKGSCRMSVMWCILITFTESWGLFVFWGSDRKWEVHTHLGILALIWHFTNCHHRQNLAQTLTGRN